MVKRLADGILIQQGDLTAMEVDAIVNAANNELILGAGVAGAIRRRGGPAIQKECDAIGSIPVGYAVVTGGGQLKARFVIHAASMETGGTTTAQMLRGSTLHALRLAAERKLKSLAFPAIGTGIAGFPMGECAEILLRLGAAHLQGETSVEKIYFVLYDQAALKVFEKEWLKVLAEYAGKKASD